MSDITQVQVPTVGESISEVQIGKWLKREGDWVESGEDLVEIETEKASVQIPAPVSGILQGIQKQDEAFAVIGEVIASIQAGDKPVGGGGTSTTTSVPNTSGVPIAPPQATGSQETRSPEMSSSFGQESFVMPAAQRLIEEHALDAGKIPATGPGGRLLKEDVVAFIRNPPSFAAPNSGSPPPTAPPPMLPSGVPQPGVTAGRLTPAIIPTGTLQSSMGSLIPEMSPHRSEEIKPLSMLRRTIAARLVQAQQTAALLTTFNEINMQPVMELRSQYKDRFAEKHGVKLGFMSFFAKAAVEALRKYTSVNAEIRDGNAFFRHYQDIGIAIGGGKGLVVPILRNVERMGFADIERSISEYAKDAGENRLQPEDLMGGTFTISNGGIYGSLLSTPIVNPPQSGILGLHTIQDRPIAEHGEVVIRPMMYVALTYDHRIVDGREAVGFLKTIKEVIEEPARLFLEL